MTELNTAQTPSLLSRIGTGIMDVLMDFAHARARAAEFQSHLDMSDAQLAEKGLRREQIARYVCRDMIT